MLQVTSSLVQQVHIVLWSYSYLSVRTGYKAHKQGAQTRLAVQVKAFKTYGALHPLLGWRGSSQASKRHAEKEGHCCHQR